MMKHFYTTVFSGIVLCFMSLTSFAQAKPVQDVIDPVCGKKVDLSESYDWKYAGKVYSFHSYDCRYAFKMNPQNFLIKTCVADMTAIDPVCGMKVNKSACYDTWYNKGRYHFCSFDCRETFKMSPAKFANNKCPVPDSTQVKQDVAK